jgi:Glycosyl hydrolase family 63 C-terminal domain
MSKDPERQRLDEADGGTRDWRRWGPYLAERQWGTVREDYSPDGDAWQAFPHDHARSRAYRWGEDGLLGICDSEGILCFSLALWNGADPILKERLFGLSNPEGNHGEDVKECYYYLDATPTASYLEALYKYPQARFPYERLVSENARRSTADRELELADTGAFDGGRYFDVFIEYAKAAPEDLLVRITVANRGPEAAPLHVLPTLWFRNTWSWGGGCYHRFGRPSLRRGGAGEVVADHALLGRYVLSAGTSREAGEPRWLFTENETNSERLWGLPNHTPWKKDSFHAHVIDGHDAVNPAEEGTKACAHYRLSIPAGGEIELRLRLSREGAGRDLGAGFDEVFRRRIAEADLFYEGLSRPEDAAILRQAAAGLVWSKQFYYYDVREWLSGDPLRAPPPERRRGRNSEWAHLVARDVISMPDKWEFPWFAAWDLAFHTLPFSLLDPGFARQQLLLMLREWYMAPNGQLAAYEFGLGDVNPPVHAWACRRLHQLQEGRPDESTASFLRRAFVKLAMNFTWWVNRKDPGGRNLFAGGFMGLDNVGVLDRSRLPQGVTLEQADSTAWMAHFCCEMTGIALSLAFIDPEYEDAATTFVRHFAQIADAINGVTGRGLWDDEDGFYYDHLRIDGRVEPLRVRSVVGLLPMVAVAVADQANLDRLPRMAAHMQEVLERYPRLARASTLSREEPGRTGRPQRRLLSLVPRDRLERLLRRLLDENEFLSPYGIRSLSKYHADHPYALEAGGRRFEVSYQPGESESALFGGNSNWRGPIWFPINALLIEALETYHRFYGDDLKVEFPTGSRRWLDLGQVAAELTERLLNLFRPDASGRRPCHGDDPRYAQDPHWRDLILFSEYFHGDSGRGCGASHQTGWTGLAALFARRRAIAALCA